MSFYANCAILVLAVLNIFKNGWSMSMFLISIFLSSVCTAKSYFRLGICTGPHQKHKDVNSFLKNGLISFVVLIVNIVSLITIFI